ncbi:MAG: terminase small subunit [Sphingomonas sp.]|uniref:terminase small subunit n=1 Tax=Sphingomonas sp. TaxID=28214 RepID=UPI00260E13D0|nr:terminase small subunit [Sphingomonas sp.]MDK2769903.1 terminase small subunit [Sphingomonas sp.]
MKIAIICDVWIGQPHDPGWKHAGLSMTPKQERFVQEYLLDLNATQAAIRSGYSAKTAHVIGPENLEKPEIKAAIDAAKAKREEATQVDANWVLKRLADEATADIADLYNKETGDLLPVHEWPLIWRQGLVQGIEIDALYEGHGEDRIQIGQTRKIKLDNRIRRLELIGKHVRVNAFQDQVAVIGLDALADRLARAGKRDG